MRWPRKMVPHATWKGPCQRWVKCVIRELANDIWARVSNVCNECMGTQEKCVSPDYVHFKLKLPDYGWSSKDLEGHVE